MEEEKDAQKRHSRTDAKDGSPQPSVAFAFDTKKNERKERVEPFDVERIMSEANIFGRGITRGALTRGLSMTQVMPHGMPHFYGSAGGRPVFRNCAMEPTTWRSVSLGILG